MNGGSQMRKPITSIALTLCMLLSMLVIPAHAAGAGLVASKTTLNPEETFTLSYTVPNSVSGVDAISIEIAFDNTKFEATNIVYADIDPLVRDTNHTVLQANTNGRFRGEWSSNDETFETATTSANLQLFEATFKVKAGATAGNADFTVNILEIADEIASDLCGAAGATKTKATVNITGAAVTHTVTITPGANMSPTGMKTQIVNEGSAITDVVFTADAGYYFPTSYSVADVSGIKVTRNSYTRITVSGTPTADASITLTAPTEKQEEATPAATFTATGADSGTLSGVDSEMKYSIDGGSNWKNITGTTATITTGVTAAKDIQVKKPATDPDTRLDSEVQSIDVTQAAKPIGVTGAACTTTDNDDGKMKNVDSTMEYRKSDAASWTPVSGPEVTGLSDGTYYVRVKANGTQLASEAQTVNIAAYATTSLSGTVTITGTEKFGETLTASVTGDNSTSHNFTYTWKRGGTTVIGTGSSNTHTIVADDIGQTITCEVSADDCSGVIRATTGTIAKADGPAAPGGLAGVAPTSSGGSDGKITGTTATMEWDDSSSFTSPTDCSASATTGFAAGTYYVRVKKTTTHKAGTAAIVTIPAYTAPGTKYTISVASGKATNSAGAVITNAASGETVMLTANAAPSGQIFDKWVVVSGGISLTNAASATTRFTMPAKAVSVKATYKTAPGGGTSTGGGSSSGSSSDPTYGITVEQARHGTITVSPRYASKGDTVTITVKPDAGYELDTLTVLDKSGDRVKIAEKNGKYTFTMPSGKVTVKGSFAPEAPEQIFADVPADAYYYDAVKWAAEQGITGGTGNGMFSPNAPCTRAQIVTFLWRSAGSPAPRSMSSFADGPADAYYAQAVAWAVENGITGGTGNGMFSPNAPCTRAQSVTFLYRAAGSPAVSGGNFFSDVAADAYYVNAVAWAAEKGITGGIGNGLFGSGSPCTRAQIVTFLFRYMGK